MGRKIPGRKHKGVKDPEKQRAERLAKIKDKINTAPSDPDDQQISKSLSRIIDLKNKVKEGIFNKKKSKPAVQKQVRKFPGKPEKMVPKFEQLPEESDRDFKLRVNRICSEVIREAAFEDKFHVDIKRDEKGEVQAVEKRPKDELEILLKKLHKEKKSAKNSKGKKKKKIKEEDKTPRLTKSQKWKLKQSEKKKRKQAQKEEDYSFGPQRENVKFGDIAHAPPTLVAPKKVTKLEGAPRPGQKQLLLKTALNNASPNSKPPQFTKQENSNKKRLNNTTTIDKKAKRKKLPHALRRQLEKQQKEIIESYKTIKANKYSSS